MSFVGLLATTSAKLWLSPEPGGVVALVDFDDRVQHYEVVETI
jgi:hypothetical protein